MGGIGDYAIAYFKGMMVLMFAIGASAGVGGFFLLRFLVHHIHIWWR